MSDQYAYRPEFVLALLPQAFDRFATPKYDEDEDRRGGGDPATGGNTLAHLADIRKHLSRLPRVYQSALYWYAHGESPTPNGEIALLIVTDRLNNAA